MVEGPGADVDTGTSCPRCGAPAPAGTSTCRHCGFAFFEAPARRSLPRPSPVWTLATLLVVAGGVSIAVVLSRDSAAEAPAPVPAVSAQRQLEHQLRASGVSDADSVRCRDSIRPDRLTRCELLYDNGDTQLLLIALTKDGELDIEQPYPAQRRSGG